MPINYYSYDDFASIAKAAILKNLPGINPTVFGSIQRAYAESTAAVGVSLQFVLRDIVKQLFPQTAEGDYLDLLGEYEGIPRPAATQATGIINVSGTEGYQIPIGTIFKNDNGFEYETTQTVTINDNVGSISSITRTGTQATATTVTDHHLVSGTINILGADQSEYNGTVTITVTARNEFIYTVSGAPATPATGTISYSSIYAAVPVTSSDSGSNQNVEKDGSFTLSDPTEISGVSSNGNAQYDGISGGSDEADDDTYRQLILASRTNITGVFTNEEIEIAVLSRSGNTRVFIKNPSDSGAGGYLDPEPGEVSIFFLRDNDANIIPTPSIVSETKQLIIENAGLPSNTPEQFLYVQGPNLLEVDFIFSSITPDSTSMRNAIEQNIIAFFQDNADFEQNISIDSIRGAIIQTVDPETNIQLTNFSLSSPVADIVVASGEIAIQGDITF